MKFSKQFKPFKTDEDTEEQYILLDEFYEFLKKDNVQLRRSNLRRTFQSYRGGLKVFNNKEIIPVFSILKYCFQYSESSQACNNISKQITCEILQPKEKENQLTAYISSSFDLYRLIAKTKFHDNLSLFDTWTVDERCILTLIVEHKAQFTIEEWKKICWFELHFSKSIESYKSYHDLEYEDLLQLKYAKFQSILSFKECQQILSKVFPVQIKEKQCRFDSAEKLNQVEIFTRKKHVPIVIDNQLKFVFQEHTDEHDAVVICFDVVNSVSKNCIHVVVGVSQVLSEQCYKDFCARSVYFVRRKHDTNIETLYFIDRRKLAAYVIEEDDSYARFHLRDDIENEKLTGIVYTWRSEQSLDSSDFCEENDDETVCEACLHDVTAKPLSVGSFSLENEWYLETPIEVQIILEAFLNKRSVRINTNQHQYLAEKVQNLYAAYDLLLNLYNKDFLGLFQQKSTKELLIEYKSISSVFDITSASGATSVLKSAENKLKRNANVDVFYYNTYLKNQELSYTTITGACRDLVNLRECHVILMLDNLVRLQYISDPNPGVHRSKQICTLPITLQGLPTDSEITSSWHLPECDGSACCICKRSEPLGKDDINRVLLQTHGHEQQAHSQFSRLMTWGNTRLWGSLTDEILGHLDNTSTEPFPDNYNTDSDFSKAATAIQDDAPIPDPNTPDENQEEDIDLGNVLCILDGCAVVPTESTEDADFGDENDDSVITNLEKSIDQMSIIDEEQEDSCESIQELLSSLDFTKFRVPKLLCRHPPPATGRDDDISKIREILDDVLTKMGYLVDKEKQANRILCGPDHKIGQCLLRLMDMDDKYYSFLPEFPLLHLRKSKITILFSAYKDAGLVELVRFMKDEDQDDWTKLVSIQHIDVATRYIKRVAVALHLAFLVSFSKTLNAEDLECFINDMESNNAKEASTTWSTKCETYLHLGSEKNATFALHRDMMKHCDNVVAVALSERLGGPDGYALLLATVKSSLPFSFVNNASSYAPYCVKLLYHHYRAGHFHRHMKEVMYTTPFKNSSRNFACDTKREMDHIDVLKRFRSGSNTSSITCRMSLIDSLNETRKSKPDKNENKAVDDDKLGWEITEIDQAHIFPTAALILRRNGQSTEENTVPFNVYSKTPVVLPSTILDECSEDVGKYLLLRYISKQHLFGLSEIDIPSTEGIKGTPELISRAKRSTGITIKRTIKSKVHILKSEKEAKEELRKKTVAKETRRIDCLSSDNNACQALVKPDSSKPKVMKALGIQRALKALLRTCLGKGNNTVQEDLNPYMTLNLTSIPLSITASMKLCTMEFAGVKFKVGNIKTGKEYIQLVENLIKSVIKRNTSAPTVVVCEEKYMFTPDDLKAGTRNQRKTKQAANVNHLKTGSSILNETVFNKDALTKTDTGKEKISTFLAENIEMLKFENAFTLVIDSQLHVNDDDKYCTPVMRKYTSSLECSNVQLLSNVKQRKGEAEMSVIDWMVHFKDQLQEGDRVVCLVTSGDIDAVYTHMYAVNKYWPRDTNGNYKMPVFVVLQKPRSKVDIYDITSILELVERTFGDMAIGMKVALSLCMGGNDFIPKFHLVSHDTILKQMVAHPLYTNNLFRMEDGRMKIQVDIFVDFVRTLYCPKRHKNELMSYNDVRAITIGKSVTNQGLKTSDPRKWLPPQSAIERMAHLIQIQIDYLDTAGHHHSFMPNFLESSCLKKNACGEVEFDFGPEAHFDTTDELPDRTTKPKKRHLESTPQKGARRKRPLTSTPKSKRQ